MATSATESTNQRTNSVATTTTTATKEGDKNVNTNHQTAVIKESKMKITPSRVIRWSGLAAILAGLIYAGIQPIHPLDNISSVNTTAWAIITPLKTVMCFLFLLGLTGLYSRQVEKVGWLGLVGFLMLSLMWALQTAYIFAEAFILPPLAATSPKFVQAVFIGVITQRPTEVDLGALPAIFAAVGILYLLGGLMFGIATFRAGILSRWAAALLAVAAALTPLAALVPHETQRLAGIPVGLAIAWLGYSLLTERREKVSEPVSGRISPQFSQVASE